MRPLCFIFPVLVAGAGCAFQPRSDKPAPLPITGTGGITGAGNGPGTGGIASTGGRTFLPGTGGSPVVSCMGLRCQQTICTGSGCKVPACAAGETTTVTGTVYDPAGKVPLYNAIVYVPNAPLADLHEGPSCDLCDTALSGDPVAHAETDVAGHFSLTDMPVGDNIPIVVQIGKWRRQTTIANVPACTTTALTDPNQTRLPRNQNEGHIPRIALSTGGADALECLLRKIGIQDSEFTPETGMGRINLYAGGMNTGGNNNGDGTLGYAPTLNGGALFTRSPGWWDSVDNLNQYDIVLLSCEGVESSTNKSLAARQAMQTFADAGGRVFASHWHNYWIEFGPAPWPTAAIFSHQNDPPNPFTTTIDQTFPKGMALAQWLVNVGASPAPGGALVINGAKRTLTGVNAPTQQWIYGANPATVQYFSFTTPYGTGSCGKLVFSDLHVTSGAGGNLNDDSAPNLPFPTGCRTTDLSPQEKALEFMLFDLSACIIPTPPPPPTPVPPPPIP
jgi:hypothetical protein